MRHADHPLAQNSSFPMGLTGAPNEMIGGYDQTPEAEEDSEKILAHFDPEELLELDELQGEVIIDPETNLRDYTSLSKLLSHPEVREIVKQGIATEKETNPIQRFSMGGEVEPGKPFDPELEKLRREGRKGDTELAIITPELLEIFSEWMGKEPDINPMTGLPEFFSFRNMLRSAVRVVGTAFGPITGFLAGKLTGQSTSAALKNAGIGAALTALPFIGSALGGSAGLSGLFGGAKTLGAGIGNIGSGLSSMFAPSTGGGIVSGLNSVGTMMPTAASQVATQGIGQAALQAAGQGGSGILSTLLSKGLPLAGSALLMAKGHRDEQKSLRDYQRSLEDRENRDRNEQAALREKYGFNAPLKPVRPFQWKQTNNMPTQYEMERGIVPKAFDYNLAEPYAHGGPIRGNGKGQKDNVPMNLKENSYIIDASTVSDIGDGNTDAGIQELERFFSRIPSYKTSSHAQGGYIQALVSDGEYEIPPEKVTALGKGSNQKGAKILKGLVKEIRSKKRNSGSKLPPKAKPIGGYIKGLHHKAA